jgi:type IV pilus assembly protein PilM
MPSASDCWGIEVGANAIKAVRLQKSGSDVVLTDYDLIPFKKVLTTPDLDVSEAIRVHLDQFLSRHTIGKATVVTSVPGHMAFARFAKLPPVEPKRVPDIVKFEAVQQIPFPIEQVEWDYQIFQHKDSPDVEVGIFAITKDRVLTWLSNFHAVGLPVHGMTLSPLAVYNGLAHDMGMNDDSPGTMFMDIGTSATDLIIVEGGRIWLRTIPIGGTHFTDALVRSFKLSHSKAEKIKREAATSKYARQIFQAMRPVFVDLVGEVQKSLGFYQSLNRDAQLQKLVGIGSTFRLPGLQKFLKQQLQLDVTKLESFSKLEIDGKTASTFAEHALEMGTAYGLALQGLEMERVSANLLPTTMVRQQMWKAKHPYMIAAAAIIAISASVGYTRLWLDQKAYGANAGLRQEIASIVGGAESLKGRWKSIEGGSDPRSKIENLRRILDYRSVVPMILTDVEGAVASADPQPELHSGDPLLIKKVPRNQRRVIHVDQVLTEYRYEGGEAGSLPWGERQVVEYGEGELGTRPGQPPADPSVTGGATPGAKLPSFIVTITGTTPQQQVSTFLSETFITHLIRREQAMEEMDRAHAQDPSKPPRPRPYRTARDDRNQYDLKILLIAPASTVNKSGPGSTGPRVDTPAPAPTGRIIAGAGGEGFGGERPAPAVAVASAGPAKLEDLLPSDPLADEDSAKDWHFVIQWRVELTRPEDARQITTGDIIVPEATTAPAPVDAATVAPPPEPSAAPAPAPADPAAPAAPAPADPAAPPPAPAPADPAAPAPTPAAPTNNPAARIEPLSPAVVTSIAEAH